jgi:hypothetical protein
MNDFSANPVATTVQPCPLATRTPSERHFIAIEMLDEADKPVVGLAYTVKLPTGEVVRGYLDEKGSARIDGIPVSGICQVGFPDLDQDVWEVLSSA